MKGLFVKMSNKLCLGVCISFLGMMITPPPYCRGIVA